MARQQRIKDRRPTYTMKTLQQAQKGQRAFIPIHVKKCDSTIRLRRQTLPPAAKFGTSFGEAALTFHRG
ncbi:uncharacterized protein PITG_01544 [Phytophthora infestans T30-4]|uniref:Uncharacterized protein n=1 Tax=Phytophthora infestans (strain T30-4) TaxID=403677 RepID=D0MTH8_PHYIT|nr:uncharacterized protein PITG_01544 [Phytophthora infestans T30-4]EEY61275.1 hypothetical protein PITG_01544 [Phytophthora infestans T30-4]|eukprot:XP_002908192.1 hypothetical protein PITG_01544 [Phytophthora infestans T30-4]